jgi:hypothetical protein
MIKEQIYTRVVEYTHNSFQIFAKRVLGAKILEILQKNKETKANTSKYDSECLTNTSVFHFNYLEKKSSNDDNESVKVFKQRKTVSSLVDPNTD